MKTNYTILPGDNAGAIVLAFVKALNEEDFDTARTYASNDMKFEGVLGSRNSADAYFKDMKDMKLKYKIQKVFADGDDICIFYDLKISGTTLFGCGWYHVKKGKIANLRVLFDPRKLIEQSDKN